MKYRTLLNRINSLTGKTANGVKFPYLPRMNSIIGNIVSKQFTVIAGDSGFGKTEFMDFHYLYNILMTWHKQGTRDNIKILYFSSKTKEEVKYLKLMASYIWLNSNLRVDIPTLLNRANKKNITSAALLDAVKLSKEFFIDIELEDVLEVYDGNISISYINEKLYDYYTSIGNIDEDNNFTPYDEHINDKLYVFIDSADVISTYVQSNKVSRDEATKLLIDTLQDTIKKSNASVIVSVNTTTHKYIKGVKDTIPDYKDLGIWGNYCDIGIVIHDPIKAHTIKLLSPESYDTDYYVRNGVNLLKYWFVVSNSNGADLVYNKIITLPGSNFSFEIDESTEITDIVDTIGLIQDTENLYI